MKTINIIINELINNGNSVKDIAEELEVSSALVSTWKNKDNDFVPRLPIATRIFKAYGYTTYPYDVRALRTV